MQQSALLLTN